MTDAHETYSLDANVLIQAWQNYYSPKICPDYWVVLNDLGEKGQIFLAEEIRDEITGTDDDLSEWLRSSSIPIRKTDGNVTNCWSKILQAHNDHRYLVAAAKGRSLGDPWVISHALDAGAIVVTKEEFVPNYKPTKIKIPNVCKNMGIESINDFQLLQRLNIQFSCRPILAVDKTD
jgi:hypothetical protein